MYRHFSWRVLDFQISKNMEEFKVVIHYTDTHFLFLRKERESLRGRRNANNIDSNRHHSNGSRPNIKQRSLFVIKRTYAMYEMSYKNVVKERP